MNAKAQQFLADLDRSYNNKESYCMECSVPKNKWFDYRIFHPEERVTYLLAINEITLPEFLTALVEEDPEMGSYHGRKIGDPPGDAMYRWRCGAVFNGCFSRKKLVAVLERLR